MERHAVKIPRHMKKLLLFLTLIVGAHAADITVTKVSGTNAITGDLNFPSGRTLSLSSGATLSLAAGTFSPAANSINWSALTGQPTTLAGYGITDPIVLTSGSYANPSWITTLAGSKITGILSVNQMPAFSGDATSSAGTAALTLAASGVTLGSYGSATQSPVITFDAKGRATAASVVTVTPAFGSLTGTPTSAAGYGIVNGSNLDLWGAKVVPSGTVADLSSAQVFTNKSVSGSANTFTNIPLATAVTGILPSTSHPALTGDVTATAGTTVTAYAGVVPAAKGGAGTINGLLKANGAGLVSQAISGTDYQPAGNFISALTGDVTASGPGSASAAVTRINGISLAGLATGILKNTTTTGIPSIAAAGSDYEVPITFSTGLTRLTNTVTVNTSQNIAKLSNLTSNGFVKTSGGDGTLSVDTSSYITGNQTITLSGDATGSGATSIAVTNTKLNGVSFAGLATGILKNTTSTGAPSIAVAGTDYVAPAGAGSVSGLTLRGAVYAASANTLASTAALTNGQFLIGSTSASPVAGTLAGTANEITITNGAGTIAASLPSALTFTGKSVTGGAFAATTLDGPVGSVTPAAGSFTVLNTTGTISENATNPVIQAVSGVAGNAAKFFASDGTNTAQFALSGGVGFVDFPATLSFRDTGAANATRAIITSTGLNSTVIGATTPAAASVTTLSATGLVTPNAGIKGITGGTDASAGNVGEYIPGSRLIASAVSITSGASLNIISISLTAGDWDVGGVVQFNPAGSTVMGLKIAAINTITGTLPNTDFFQDSRDASTSITGARHFQVTPTVRISISTTTTVYLVAYCEFTVSTLTGSGSIWARRVQPGS